MHVMQQTSTAGSALALVGTPTDDQMVKTRARATSFGSGADRWFGIAARYVDESNYYYLTVRNSNTVSLRKVVNGAVTVLGTVSRTVGQTPGTTCASTRSATNCGVSSMACKYCRLSIRRTPLARAESSLTRPQPST